MSRLLQPGIFILNRLRYPQKFLLISLLIALPLVLTLLLLFSETQPKIEFSRRELVGSHYIHKLIELCSINQQSHRLADNSDKTNVEKYHTDFDALLTDIRTEPESSSIFTTSQSLDQIEQLHIALRTVEISGNNNAIDQAHSAITEAIQAEIARVGDISNLILDPELTTYYLINIAVVQTPEQIRLLEQAHNLLSEVSVSPNTNSASELFALAGQLDASVNNTRRAVEIATSADSTLAPVLTAEISDSLTTVAGVSNALHNAESAGQISAATRGDLINTALLSNIRLADTALNALDTRLEERIQRLNQKNELAIVVSSGLLVVLVYLLIGFYVTTMRAINLLDRASRGLDTGSTINTVTLKTRDEIGQIIESFNRLMRALAEESSERQAAVAEQNRLHESIIQAQLATLGELSVPLIPLTNRVALLPLIGVIDALRAQHIIKTLLDGIAVHRARIVIIDLSGVRVVDTHVAQTLVHAATGARLLGAEVSLVGLRAEVAQTVAHLNIDFGGITFHATLEEALAAHLRNEQLEDTLAARA